MALPKIQQAITQHWPRNVMQNQKNVQDLLACAAFVTVDMSLAALSVVGPLRYLHPSNAFMLPGTPFAAVSWRKFMNEKETTEVRSAYRELHAELHQMALAISCHAQHG
jgi:hypothetical protein